MLENVLILQELLNSRFMCLLLEKILDTQLLNFCKEKQKLRRKFNVQTLLPRLHQMSRTKLFRSYLQLNSSDCQSKSRQDNMNECHISVVSKATVAEQCQHKYDYLPGYSIIFLYVQHQTLKYKSR
jgi:hypothetical protein